MDTVRSFKGLNIRSIQDYLSNCDVPFQPSNVYSTQSETSFIDTNRRKSMYRTITDPDLFRLVEDLIMGEINEGDAEYQYVLWKNGSDITHIKYDEGGFFKRHRDFNSTTSNLIEEFSLIVCVTPEEEAAMGVEGGETSIITFGGPNSNPVEKIFDTKTPGCALLFRKDLNHEGKELIRGVKHIITANIFAVKKTQSEQVLYVTFPEEEEEEEEEEGTGKGGVSAASKTAIQRVANDSKSYVLPVSRLKGTRLEDHVRDTNAQAEAEGNDPPQVITFICSDFTFEQFGVVARILNRCYVDEGSISRAKDCLGYFGPFDVQNILVDLALEDSVGDAEQEEHSGDADTDMSKDANDDAPVDAADIIVCENEARMQAVLDVARQFNEPYVPFKILFVEGMLQYFDGDGNGCNAPFDVPMTAAAAFVGDYNNVLALWCLDQKFYPTEFTLQGALEDFNFFVCAPEDKREQLLNLDLGEKVELFHPPPGANYPSWEMPFFTYMGETESTEQFLEWGFGLGLNVRVDDNELKSGLLKYMFNKHERSDVKPLDLRAGLSKESEIVHRVNSLFHLDGNGKACFTREQAELASKYIASIGLEEKVKASLNKKQFELPQVSEKVSMVYCNDDRYGKMNVLWVCGVMRLEENAEASSTDESAENAEASSTDESAENAEASSTEESAENDEHVDVEFDAWPSAEGKAMVEHAKRLGNMYAEICESGGELPEEWWEYYSDESSELEFDDYSHDEGDESSELRFEQDSYDEGDESD